MKVHVYHRTATVDEDIESQIESLRNQALAQGYTIEGSYLDNGSSGVTLDRPGLNQLRADARHGIVKAVLASDPSCLAIGADDLYSLKEELTGLGIEIHFIGLATPSGQMYC